MNGKREKTFSDPENSSIGYGELGTVLDTPQLGMPRQRVAENSGPLRFDFIIHLRNRGCDGLITVKLPGQWLASQCHGDAK